jgi:23S rRNA pseudouridine955/2504/2580 synthase
MTKPESAVRLIEVDEGQHGQRVDNFLGRYLKGVPRAHLYRLLRTGQVRVNGRRVKPDTRVEAGDKVRVPPVRTGVASEPVSIPEAAGQRLDGAVLVEDAHVLVLNKPAGLPVHAGSGFRYGVIEALRGRREHAPMLELVHRLDRGTSGCLVIAKSRAALKELNQALRDGRVVKEYMALLAGHWRGGARTVDVALERRSGARSAATVHVDEAGKEAISEFRPLRHYRGATLVAVRIGTGRTHQIRVHAAHLGHPIAGDEKYGDFAFNREMRRAGLRRLFLHAQRIEFALQCAGRRYAIEAPLPEDLQAVLETLEQ